MNIVKVVNKYILVLVCGMSPFLSVANNKYNIEVELEPAKRMLKGHLDMSFYNSTNDTLQEIWVHLWPNAYSGHHTPWAKQMVQLSQMDFRYGKSLGKIDSLNFSYNGTALTLMTSDEQPDVGVILLNEPLLPGKSIQIHTPFRVKLPEMVSRSGYSGSFYSVTQWYPKFAVYQGGEWQAMPYLEQGEFFSDFADYHVKVTLPSAYSFAATGYKYKNIDTTQAKVTYEVNLSDIHDFAWYASRKFIVKQKEITLESGRKVTIQAYVQNEEIIEDIFHYASETIEYMSKNLGEYPYDVCTVVQGVAGVGNGMEYPTICNIEGGATLREEVVHEVIHNWWYGILANNERKEPFLDESFTSYYEQRIIRELSEPGWLEENKGAAKYFGINRLPEKPLEKSLVLQQYRTNLQQAANLSSEEYSGLNYYAVLYAKGAFDIKNLEGYLGRENFDQIMQEFYEKKKFKHVSIAELQSHFNEKSEKDTQWFFEGVLKSSTISDLAVKNIRREDTLLNVTLKNKKSLKTAAEVTLVDKDLNVLESIWVEDFQDEKQISFTHHKDAYAVLIDPQWLTPESNRRNNFSRISGIQKWKPLQVRLFGSLEDPTKNQLFMTPVLAGNKYDGFMLGLALYNRVFPVKKLEYELVPFFAFKSKQFNWIGNVSYHILPKQQKTVDIEIGLHSKSFTMNNRPIELRFIKLQPFVEATFRKLSNDNGPIHKVGYRNVQIWQDAYAAQRDTVTNEVTFSKIKNQFNTSEFWYSLQNLHAIFPHELRTVVRFDKDYLRQSVEYKQKFRYTQKGAFVHLRLFAGAFYYRNNDISFRRNAVVGFNLSGINGRNDYLYDGNYFGRNAQEGFASRQMMMGEGNFKVFTPLQNIPEGKTVNGLFALNFKIDAPVKWLPIQLFADLGYSVDKVLMPDNLLPVKQFHYDLGFNISLLDEAVEVYFPLLMSDNFRTYYKSNLPKFGQRITFAINMDKLNFHKGIRKNLLEKVMK